MFIFNNLELEDRMLEAGSVMARKCYLQLYSYENKVY